MFICYFRRSLQRPCKKSSGARKHFSGNERCWLVGLYHTSQCSTGNKNTTDLLRAEWLYTLFNWVSCIADRRRQLSCVGEGVYSDATQLNSTRRRVELSSLSGRFAPLDVSIKGRFATSLDVSPPDDKD